MDGSALDSAGSWDTVSVLNIWTQSLETFAPILDSRGDGGPNSLAWPLANLALFLPFATARKMTVSEVWWWNGTTAGGNVDVGIYDRAGTRIQSLGSTARGSVSTVVSSTTWTDLILEAGEYYMAFAVNGTNNIQATGSAAGLCEALGICEMTSAFALPATATLSRTTRAYIPAFGLRCSTVAAS